MNHYKYLLSPDIAKHCRKVGRRFTTLELAVIVAHNEEMPRKDRHNAWREILAEYPDMPIPKQYGFGNHGSLRDSLLAQIEWEERWLEDFYVPGDNTVYLPSGIHDDTAYPIDKCFSSVEKAFEGAIDKFHRISFYESVTICKDKIDGSEERSWVKLNLKGEVIHFGGLYGESPCNLYGYFIDLPVPFKRGDLVTINGKTPIVLDFPIWESAAYERLVSLITSNEEITESDWNTYEYHQNGSYYEVFENALHCQTCYPNYIWRLRYFKAAELTGLEKFLGFLSEYIKKDECRLDSLVNTFLRYKIESDCENRIW